MEWKKGFDMGTVNRDKAGIKVVAAYRVPRNLNTIIGIMEAPNAEIAEKFSSNPNLKAAMKKAGIISVPEIKISNQVQ